MGLTNLSLCCCCTSTAPSPSKEASVSNINGTDSEKSRKAAEVKSSSASQKLPDLVVSTQTSYKSFLVKVCNGPAVFAKVEMNLRLYEASPRKDRRDLDCRSGVLTHCL